MQYIAPVFAKQSSAQTHLNNQYDEKTTDLPLLYGRAAMRVIIPACFRTDGSDGMEQHYRRPRGRRVDGF